MTTVFNGKLDKSKETKGTIVYQSDDYGTIYVPKLLLKKPYADSILVTIQTEEK